MPQSAFIVQVPQSETVVADLRARFDASSRLGVPAHITILVPFMSPEQITPDVLGRAQAAIDQVGRFEATAYLAPEPAAPFVALTEGLVRAFPAFLPFGGAHTSIIPHLTVAHGNAADAQQAAAELALRLERDGPINGVCSAITLLENSAGRWRVMHTLKVHGIAP